MGVRDSRFGRDAGCEECWVLRMLGVRDVECKGCWDDGRNHECEEGCVGQGFWVYIF